jgi:uncharacterized protein YdeI (BOF family)
MKTFAKTMGFAALSALIATGAIANNNTKAAPDMKDGASITISGMVDKVNSETEFTLRDSAGTIDIDLPKDQSVVLQKGQSVTVTGVVDKDINGTDINATRVDVSKTLGKAISDGIEANTDISLKGATTTTVAALPSTGLVKVHGTVESVDNDKEFTLKDGTGSVNVDVESNQHAALKEGAKVTVIGQVSDGILGKDINASDVVVSR